jgi:hypothetical protein
MTIHEPRLKTSWTFELVRTVLGRLLRTFLPTRRLSENSTDRIFNGACQRVQRVLARHRGAKDPFSDKDKLAKVISSTAKRAPDWRHKRMFELPKSGKLGKGITLAPQQAQESKSTTTSCVGSAMRLVNNTQMLRTDNNAFGDY